MKIAWFSPFSRKSAIGKYSQAVTAALAKDFTVDIWSAERENLLETPLDIHYYSLKEDLSSRLADYDLAVYNMGNHLPYHHAVYEVLRRVPGVVVLHDYVMHHFFAAYYLEYRRDFDGYLREMEVLYGEEGKQRALALRNGRSKPVWETEEVGRFPFFEKCLAGALGVIAHSRYLAEHAARHFFGPVAAIYLPFFEYDRSRIDQRITKRDLQVPEDKLLLLTVGYVNPNKRVDKILQALGEMPEVAEKIYYVIIGAHDHVEYFEKVKQTIARYKLENQVRFLGFAPDEVLYSYLLNADIVATLRYPTTEGASASLVEQLYFGKPAIVTDTGFYHEFPEDTVVKVNPQREIEDLKKALKRLVADQDYRLQVGARGKDFAFANFTVDVYRRKFAAFIEKVKSGQPVLNFIDKVSRELALLSISGEMQLVETVSQEITWLVKQHSRSTP